MKALIYNLTFPYRNYRKEFRRYLLLILIPIFILSILYVTVFFVTRNQLRSSAETTTQYFFDQAGEMMDDVSSISHAISYDVHILNALKSPSDSYQIQYQAADTLRAFKNASRSISNIYIVREDRGIILSDYGIIHPVSLEVILSKCGASYDDLYSSGDQAYFQFLSADNHAPYCISRIYDTDGKPLGTVIISTNMARFKMLFTNLNVPLCAIFNDDFYISSFVLGLPESLKTNGHFDWSDTNAICSLFGEPVTCFYSEQDDFTFLVALTNSQYFRPLHLIAGVFILYVLITLFLSYSYLLRISRKRYEAMNKMVEALPVRCADNGEYESVYESICATLRDYKTQTDVYRKRQTERNLFHLLSASDSGAFSSEQLRSCGLVPGDFCYYVTTFFVDTIYDDAFSSVQKSDIHEYLHVLFRTTVSSIAGKLDINVSFCGQHKSYTAVVYAQPERISNDSMEMLCRSVVDIISGSYNLDIRCVVSIRCCDTGQLPKAWRKNFELHAHSQSLNSQNPILFHENFDEGGALLINSDFMKQQQILINAILAHKYDMIPSMTVTLVRTHILSIKNNFELANGRLASLRNTLIEGVHTAAIENFDAFSAIEELSSEAPATELCSIVDRIYSTMAMQSEGETISNPRLIADAYIKRNLSDPNLSAALVCEVADISNQRLTRMFQAKYGMAIAEYINHCRIEAAKKLLKDKDITVTQISHQVGYYNINTLTRNFKKLEGVTPSEYRKMQQ